MTMHLSNVRVSYAKKGKKKYKSAEHKRKEMEAEQYQKEMYARLGVKPGKPSSSKDYNPSYSYRGQENKAPSLDKQSVTSCVKKESPQYTGDLVIGIAVMHKSCLQPVISQEQAEASAKMRRG